VTKPLPPGVDPALVPFARALAEILVAQEERLAATRRALRDARRALDADQRKQEKKR